MSNPNSLDVQFGFNINYKDMKKSAILKNKIDKWKLGDLTVEGKTSHQLPNSIIYF